MKINESFKTLIPALTSDEFLQLERNILKDGIREPLITWNDYLIDGHNRYEIANKHKLQFQTIKKEFDNEDKVKEWIILNQFGRRNLSNYQRSVLALALDGLFKEKAKENQGKRTDLTSGTNMPNVETRKELAKVAGVSHGTIDKVKKIEAVASTETRAKISTGEISINEAYKEIRVAEKINQINQKGSTEDVPSDDLKLISLMKKGETVVLNIDKNFHALKYAKDAGIYFQIDRFSEWGNPYYIGGDGDRDRVCDSYEIYFDRKDSLKTKIQTLKGRALGCHCHPLRCHGDYLKKLTQ